MPVLDMSPQEIRVLQEFRRLGRDEMSLEEIVAIRHPVGGGEPPALSLESSGYLDRSSSSGFQVTAKAKAFLAVEPVPMYEPVPAAKEKVAAS